MLGIDYSRMCRFFVVKDSAESQSRVWMFGRPLKILKSMEFPPFHESLDMGGI